MTRFINVASVKEPLWASISLADDLMPASARALVYSRIFLSDIQRAQVSTMEIIFHTITVMVLSGPGLISRKIKNPAIEQ